MRRARFSRKVIERDHDLVVVLPDGEPANIHHGVPSFSAFRRSVFSNREGTPPSSSSPSTTSGYSSALAQQLAFEDPQLCRRLVLVSTATGALMVPPHPRVLRQMATPRRHRDPIHGASVAGMIYGGSARQDAGVAPELLGAGAGVPTANRRGY